MIVNLNRVLDKDLCHKPGTAYIMLTPTIELSSKVHERARSLIDSPEVVGMIEKFRIVEPEDKKVARSNLQSLFAFEITRNPAYLVEEIDCDTARANPTTLFAGGIVQNTGYKAKPLDNLLARNYPLSDFAAYLPKNNTFFPEEEDVLWVQQGKNSSTSYAHSLLNNPLYRLLWEQMYDQGKLKKIELSGRTPSLGEVVETTAGVLRAVNTAKAVAHGIKGIIKP